MHHKDFDDRVTFEKLKAKLDGVKASGDSSFTARCPCHEDKHNSLSVTIGGNGKLLAHCHAGCDQQVLFAKLREIAGDDREVARGTSPKRFLRW